MTMWRARQGEMVRLKKEYGVEDRSLQIILILI